MILALALPELAAVLTPVAAIIAGLLAMLRYGPERRGVLIKESEGSFNIVNSLTHTLQAEVTRLGTENSELRAENRRLEEENQGLRTAAGRRRGDQDESP